MSFNRENVTWQSKDGTWNLGFFTVTWTGNGDPEWDVEYDFDTFEWVSKGHPTMDAATQSWDGCNPGGSSIYFYHPIPASDPWGPASGSTEACERFDGMANKLIESGWRNPSVAYRRRLW